MSTPRHYQQIVTPWTFQVHALDIPAAPPEQIRVRRFLKAIGRQYGLRITWLGVEATDNTADARGRGRRGGIANGGHCGQWVSYWHRVDIVWTSTAARPGKRSGMSRHDKTITIIETARLLLADEHPMTEQFALAKASRPRRRPVKGLNT
jgi:hypothetical protein